MAILKHDGEVQSQNVADEDVEIMALKAWHAKESYKSGCSRCRVLNAAPSQLESCS